MSTTFAQLVVAAQKLADLLTDDALLTFTDAEKDQIIAQREIILGFTNQDALPNDEAATIGGLFAKLAAFREAKNEDGRRAYEAERKASDEREKAEYLLEQVRLLKLGIIPEDPKP